MSWRYKGGPGSGALADVGSHLADVAEFLCGDIDVGQRRPAQHRDQRAPAAARRGHGPRPRRGQRRLRAGRERRLRGVLRRRSRTARGALEVSRVAAGHANCLIFEVFCENGAATLRPAPAGRDRAVPARRTSRPGRLPPGHPRPGAPLPRRRPGHGRPQRRLRPERRLRLPGPGLPRGGRRASTRHLAAALRDLRRGRAQHGAARRGRRSAGRRAAVPSRPATSPTRTTRKVSHEARRLQRLPARPAAARGARRSSPASA